MDSAPSTRFAVDSEVPGTGAGRGGHGPAAEAVDLRPHPENISDPGPQARVLQGSSAA